MTKMIISEFKKIVKDETYIVEHEFQIEDQKFYSYRYILLLSDYWKQNEYYQECRGITFDKNGNIVSRPFKKFYNLNENPSNTKESFDWNNVAAIYEKIDGCLISTLIVNNKVYFKTKADNETDEAKDCQEWFNNHLKKEELSSAIKIAHHLNYTPIFEFVSPHRHLLGYKEFNLYFLCLRNNITGELLFERTNPLVAEIVKNLNVDIENKKETIFKDLSGEELLKSIENYQENTEQEEGVVVYFNDGKVVKCKTKWFFEVKNLIGNEKIEQYIRLYLTKELDDFKALCITYNLDSSRLVEIEKVELFMDRLLIELSDIIYNLSIYKLSRKEYYLNTSEILEGNKFKNIILGILMKNYGKEINKEEIIKQLYSTLLNKLKNLKLLEDIYSEYN